MTMQMISKLFATFLKLYFGNPVYFKDTLPKGPCIFFANHSSHLDTVTILNAIPRSYNIRPLAAADYWGKNALLRWFSYHVLHAILIQRSQSQQTAPQTALLDHPLPIESMPQNTHSTSQNDTNDVPLPEALNEAAEHLLHGGSVLIFPEGTRNSTSDLLPFKKGLFLLAKKVPNAHLIPIYLHNNQKSFPKGSPIPLPLLCSVSVGAAWEHQEMIQKNLFLEQAALQVLQLKPKDPNLTS